MFEVEHGTDGTLALIGRLDAAQAPRLQAALEGVERATRLDCRQLEYVSSAGLGVLLKAQKRLGASGGVTLCNLTPHILDVFRYSGFDQIFTIEGPRP